MATEQKAEDDKPTTSSEAVGFQRIVEQYRQMKEHAETYPYVWASYIFTYGGLFLWTAYRWRKLRKTEDRVRTLQGRLRKLVESEQSASSSGTSHKAAQSSEKISPSTNKTSK